MFDKIDIKSNSTKHTPIKINPREIIQYKIKFNNNWNKTKKIKKIMLNKKEKEKCKQQINHKMLKKSK